MLAAYFKALVVLLTFHAIKLKHVQLVVMDLPVDQESALSAHTQISIVWDV